MDMRLQWIHYRSNYQYHSVKVCHIEAEQITSLNLIESELKCLYSIFCQFQISSVDKEVYAMQYGSSSGTKQKNFCAKY
jgi:hypothetical protein